MLSRIVRYDCGLYEQLSMTVRSYPFCSCLLVSDGTTINLHTCIRVRSDCFVYLESVAAHQHSNQNRNLGIYPQKATLQDFPAASDDVIRYHCFFWNNTNTDRCRQYYNLYIMDAKAR